MRNMALSAAWGAATERKLGEEHSDTRAAWDRFHKQAENVAKVQGCDGGGGLKSMVFNTCWAAVNEVWYSKESEDYRRTPQCGVTTSLLREMARRAGVAAATELHHGRAELYWSHFEHVCADAQTFTDGEGLSSLRDMTLSAAWGAASELKFGEIHSDTRAHWDRFHDQAASVAASEAVGGDDLKWMVFNTCWAWANNEWFGKESEGFLEAQERADQHFQNLGADTIVLASDEGR